MPDRMHLADLVGRLLEETEGATSLAEIWSRGLPYLKQLWQRGYVLLRPDDPVWGHETWEHELAPIMRDEDDFGIGIEVASVTGNPGSIRQSWRDWEHYFRLANPPDDFERLPEHWKQWREYQVGFFSPDDEGNQAAAQQHEVALLPTIDAKWVPVLEALGRHGNRTFKRLETR